jgi:hypothetical protein
VPPPSDAGPAPTASTNGGTYTRRYRDQKHVNELGHRKLPLGVVPAPVYQQTDLGAVTGRVLSSVIAMTGLLGDRLATPMPAAWPWSPRPRNPPESRCGRGLPQSARHEPQQCYRIDGLLPDNGTSWP